MLLDITFNLNHLEISGTQIVNWFVYTIITASAGTPATMVVKTITLSDGTTMLVYAPAP